MHESNETCVVASDHTADEAQSIGVAHDAQSKFRELVKDAHEHHPDDIDSAVAHLDRALERDDELRRELIRPIYLDGLREHLHRHRGNLNREYKAPQQNPCRYGAKDVAALAHVPARTILGSLIGGKRLSEYVGKELPAIAESERQKARGHASNAALLDALHARIGNTESTVGELVSEEDACALWDKVVGRE